MQDCSVLHIIHHFVSDHANDLVHECFACRFIAGSRKVRMCAGEWGPRDLLHDDVDRLCCTHVRLVTPVDELPDVLKVLCFFLELRDRS